MMDSRSLKRRNFKQLSLTKDSMGPVTEVHQPPPTASQDFGLASGEASQRLKRVSQLPQAKQVVDVRSIHAEDFDKIGELGFGNGGSVAKVLHKPSGIAMAQKSIWLEGNAQVRKLIVTELETLKMCDSDFIVRYYGQYLQQNNVVVCMEFMDCGSLDKIYRSIGALPEDVLRYVNAAVVDGLVYLKQLHITHRDIKPSNILVNHLGDIKLCDFGVSGVLINSIAQTFVGTSMYMSPERIQGDEYTDAADVWSLGLSLVELARGEFPISVGSDGDAPPIFELLQSIVEDPSPQLPQSCSPEFHSYVDGCLRKNKEARTTVRQLDQTPFYFSARSSLVNPLRQWAARLPTL